MANKYLKYLTILYSLIRGFFTKLTSCASGNVLLIECGHIGDAIMDASALVAMVKHYQNAGKKVSFLCSPPLWEMLLRIDDMQGVTYVGQAYSYDVSDYKALGQPLCQLKSIKFEAIIGIHNADARLHCLTACLVAQEKYCLISQTFHQGFKARLKLRLYTHIVWGDRSRHQIRWMEQLLQELQIDGYLAENARLLPAKNTYSLPQKSYIAIAVDSSDLVKRWPARSFSELIIRLLEAFDDDIYLIGKTIDPELQNEVKSGSLSGNIRIKDMVGKTSLDEWIEMIRGSSFLIGVDSGSIHVAAAAGTLAFCLIGVWSGRKCMPYDVERTAPGTKLPICVYRQDTDVDSLPCYDCGFHGRYGSGNEECLARCKSGQPCLCLSKITPDDVMEAIHHAKEIGAIS